MIDISGLFPEMRGVISPWCAADMGQTDLAGCASVALETGAGMISCAPDAVGVLWPWLEYKNIKIAARFNIGGRESWDVRVADLAGNINVAFKSGAACAQVFISVRDIDSFATALRPIRDDLFFGHELSIALDINEIDANDWPDVIGALNDMRADSVLMVMTRDRGDKSDFVGRIYAMFNAAREYGLMSNMHFAVGQNPMRVEQVWRLGRAIDASRLANMTFFVHN